MASITNGDLNDILDGIFLRELYKFGYRFLYHSDFCYLGSIWVVSNGIKRHTKGELVYSIGFTTLHVC